MVFVGLLLLKKPIYEALAGFLKTAVGYFILTTGSNGLSNTFRPVADALGSRFGIEASLVDVYFLMGQMYDEGGRAAGNQSAVLPQTQGQLLQLCERSLIQRMPVRRHPFSLLFSGK